MELLKPSDFLRRESVLFFLGSVFLTALLSTVWNRVFVSSWFAALLLLFVVSIGLSSWGQWKNARKEYLRIWQGGEAHQFPVGDDCLQEYHLDGDGLEDLSTFLSRHGFFRALKTAHIDKFVKHSPGYWGGTVFHFGVLVTILFSLLVFFTSSYRAFHLVEEEIRAPHEVSAWDETGIFGNGIDLPGPVQLTKMTPEYYENDDLRQLSLQVLFDPASHPTPVSLRINEEGRYGGIHVFLGKSFGHACSLEIAGPEKEMVATNLLVPHQEKRSKAAYRNLSFEGIPYSFMAKYFADAARQTLAIGNPLLTLRLMDKDQLLVEEKTFQIGQSQMLGPYRVTLVAVRNWAEIILCDNPGIWGVFLGFSFLIGGAGLYYLFPPREIFLVSETGGTRIFWRAPRFQECFEEEFDLIFAGLPSGHHPPGTEHGPVEHTRKKSLDRPE